MGAQPFVAEVCTFPYNFPPKGWAFCNGQLLPLSQNTALFSLLGTFYGGDGKSTFALPDIQGSVPLHQGQSTTGTEYFLGEAAGEEAVTLLQSEMPFHNHTVQGNFNPGDTFTPTPTVALTNSSPGNAYVTGSPPLVLMSPQATSVAGGSFPHNNMMPYLTLNFCIALQGIFPPRG